MNSSGLGGAFLKPMSIPSGCVVRYLEFETIRVKKIATYGSKLRYPTTAEFRLPCETRAFGKTSFAQGVTYHSSLVTRHFGWGIGK